jgi:hypothetical protein
LALALKRASKSDRQELPVPIKWDRWDFVGSGCGMANKAFRLFDIVDERKRNAGGGVLAVRGNTDTRERCSHAF